MTKEILLSQGMVALVDDTDFELLSTMKWHLAKDKGKLYAKTHPHTFCHQSMHRLIMGAKERDEVDHINGNSLDNRRCNLRIVTHKQNGCNRIKTLGLSSYTSRYKGVYLKPQNKNKPWAAQIIFEGETLHLGRFACEEEAARAYDAASEKYHGQYGKRNFTN